MKKFHKSFYSLFVLVLVLLCTSCATIMSGSKQNIRISSDPVSASVYIDAIKVGITPFGTRIPRKTEHTIMIKLDGYLPYQTTLKRTFNGWFVGNILLGGLIGIIVDPITGAIYNLKPDQVYAELAKGDAELSKNATLYKNKSDIYVAVALVIDPNWTQIAQLERINE